MKYQFLFIVIILMLLQGCSGTTVNTVTPTVQNNTGSTPVTGKTTTRVPSLIEVDEDNLNGLQIHFLHPWSGETELLLFKLVDEFNQSNRWGIHVIAQAPGSAGLLEQEAWEGLLNNIPANVIAAPTSFLLAIDQKYDDVADLNEYIYSSNYSMDPGVRDDFTPQFWMEDEVNGKRYGIPAQRTASILFYNRTWAKELGFPTPPVTPDDFSSQVCAANASMRKDSDTLNDGIGGWLISTDAPVMLSWLQSFGAEAFSGGAYDFNNESSKEAYKYLQGLVKRSCFWSGRVNQPYEYFANRQALIYSGYLQDVEPQKNAISKLGSKDEWEMILYPGKTDSTLVTSGFSYGILETKPESNLAAWFFIKWLTAPAQQVRLLESTGTLPLGRRANELMADFAAANPAWKQVVDSMEYATSVPIDADWTVVAPILEDSGWQLMKSGTTEEQIPVILAQMDDLATELIERYP